MREAIDYVNELDRSVMDLAECVSSGDDRRTWTALLASLGWLYRTEEIVRKGESSYFARRAAHPYGHRLAGLIYFRGLVEHGHQREQYKLDWVKAPVMNFTDDGLWEEATGPSPTDGMPWSTRSVVFPALHDDAPPDRHGRDALYRDIVQGRSVVVALGIAAAFLRSVVESA